ncbi:MAG TPA: tetratricopeptide repeat protein, partial [Longimicrobium sp.]|nr:tetratricopeptide repeat protein [Longimicrobium sp.]
ELGAGGDLRTVPGEDVSRAKVELSITNPNTVGEETLKKLGANVRTDLVLSGAYLALGEKGGGKVRVDLQVQDVQRGEVVAKVSDSGTEAELLDLVSRTGARLREQLGLSRLSTAQVGEVASTLPGRPEATRLYAEGLARLRGWDYPAARELLEKAAEEDPEHPLVHSALSAVWVAIGDKGKARAAAKQALALAGNLSREERMWVEGLYHEAAENWDEAAQTYQSLWTFAPDNIEYGLHLVTVQLQQQQGPEEAMKTLVALRALPPPASEDPRIDLLEARAAQASSDYKREREAAARCAARAGKLGAKLQVAQCRMLEAWALSLTGDNAGALASYDDARGICEAAGNRSCLAVALEGLGILRSDMGELDDARTKLEEALALKRALGAESSQLSTLNNLALVHQRQGDLAGARKAYEAELEISRRLGLRVWTAYAQVNLGTVFLLGSDLGQSEKSYTEALAIFQERHDGRGIAECLAGLSEIHLQRGDLDRAEARVTDGLAALRSQGIKDGMFRLLMDQGKLQRHRGALADARKTHGDALAVANELGERGSVSEARLALGELALDEGRPVEAQALARQAADEFAAQKLPGWETRARSFLAIALLADHKLPEARQELTAAGGLVDQGTGREDRAYYRIAMARVDGAAGTLTRATRLLESDLRELTRLEQLPLQYEARLALGELGLAGAHVASAKRDLKALAREAKAHQFHLVARKALAKAEN